MTYRYVAQKQLSVGMVQRSWDYLQIHDIEKWIHVRTGILDCQSNIFGEIVGFRESPGVGATAVYPGVEYAGHDPGPGPTASAE